MKRRVALWIGGGMLTALCILTYLLLFQTYLFSNLIVNSTNKYFFNPRGLKISGVIQGGVLRNLVGVKQLQISQFPGEEGLLASDELVASGLDWNWSTNELSIEKLSFDRLLIDSQHAQANIQDDAVANTSISIIIQNMLAEDVEISFPMADSIQQIVVPRLHTTLWYIDRYLSTQIHDGIVIWPELVTDTLNLTGLFGLSPSKEYEIKDLVLNTPKQSLNIDLTTLDSKLKAHFKGSNLLMDRFKLFSLPSIVANTQLDFDIDYLHERESTLITGKGSALLNGRDIPFQINGYESDSSGEQLDLFLGTELKSANVIASRTHSGHSKARINLFRLDLTPIINTENIYFSEPIGNIVVNGVDGEYDIETELTSFKFNTLRYDTLKSKVGYSDQTGLRISKGLVTQAGNRLNLTGNIGTGEIVLDGDINISDFSFLNVLEISNQISGNIFTQFNISGQPASPRLTALIHPNSLSYAKRLTLTGDGKLVLNFNNDILTGDIALLGTSGFLFGDSLQSYSISANLSEDGYTLEDFHLQGLHNLVSVNGGFLHNKVILNKLNMLKGQNQLKLADTLIIDRLEDGVFQVPSTVLSFNNGGLALEGSFSKRRGYALESEFELIDVARIMNFFRLRDDFSGMASGSASISGALTNPIIDANLKLKRGRTLDYPSDSADVDLSITSSHVIANNIDAYTSGGSLNLKGSLPWGYKVKSSDIGNTSQNFAITTQNYLMKDLNFTSIADLPISGRTTGSAVIRGTPNNTKIEAQLTVETATFDALKFSRAYSELNYEGNLITLDTLSMVSNWGYGYGTAFLPISLDLISEDRMAVADRDMGLDFEFNLNEIPFLSSYIASIDAIEGDFIGNMSFSGPFTAPIRNGKVRGHNGRLEIALLGNPVTNIHAEATLVDNTLNIDHFSGKMNFSAGSNLNTQGAVGWLAEKAGDLIGVNATSNYAGDVTATGSLDLKSFFEPRFDIDVKAHEVYYRSTDGLIEAIADASLKYTGQDTLKVEGVIPVLRAGYYENFESETSYDEVVSKTDSILFKYSLNTQFVSDLLISNDQMDAEFEGELWLLDYGDDIMRFSGTLTVIEGGKFYYLGNELNLLSGEIIFNSVDFNPQINMETEIDIGGDRVSLKLSGDLNEPELLINVIDSENNQLTQSDVLTYLTLNKTVVELSFDESALDPVKSYSELLVEKQISKLGREYIGLDLVGVNLASDSTANARFQLGQRLSKNLMVKYEGAIQPTGGQSDYDFGFEYQINKNVSVTSTINQNGTVELNGRLKFTY